MKTLKIPKKFNHMVREVDTEEDHYVIFLSDSYLTSDTGKDIIEGKTKKEIVKKLKECVCIECSKCLARCTSACNKSCKHYFYQ